MELTILSLSFLALLVLGVPVAFSIGLASVATAVSYTHLTLPTKRIV